MNTDKNIKIAENKPAGYILLGSCTDFIGKHYELLNINGSIMARIKINFCREEENTYHNEETGESYTRKTFLVSDKGGGWYRYYGNGFDRVVD